MTCDSLSEDGPLGGVFLDIDFCISQPRISARKLETCHRNDVKAENERQFTKRCHFPSAVRLYGSRIVFTSTSRVSSCFSFLFWALLTPSPSAPHVPPSCRSADSNQSQAPPCSFFASPAAFPSPQTVHH